MEMKFYDSKGAFEYTLSLPIYITVVNKIFCSSNCQFLDRDHGFCDYHEMQLKQKIFSEAEKTWAFGRCDGCMRDTDESGKYKVVDRLYEFMLYLRE